MSTTSTPETTKITDMQDRPVLIMTEMGGPQGRCRIIWVVGQGHTAEVDIDADLDEIDQMEGEMSQQFLVFADEDEDGNPLPAVEASEEFGCDIYELVRVKL